jgi:hypothetical protein
LQPDIGRFETRFHVNAVKLGIVVVVLERIVQIAQHLPRALTLNAVELSLSGRRRAQQGSGDNDGNSERPQVNP